MINLTTVSEALKVLYINPIREFVNMKADPFASRILATSDNITGYQKIVRAVQIGANGGAGAGTETGMLPVAGENMYKQFESTIKNLYGTISISDKILKSATGADAGSFINALQRDVDTLIETLKFSLARQIYGDGSGVLVKLAAISAANSKTVTVASGSISHNLLPGLTVDVYDSTGTLITNGTTRIVDIDHSTGKVTFDIALKNSASTAAGAYITMQGSKDLEITGMGAIFDTTGHPTLYGLERGTYSWMKPYTASLGSITEWGIQNGINTIEDTYNVTINHIACGNDAYKFYMELMNQRRAINDVMVLEGGHKALNFNGMPLVRNKFLAPATIDLYDTSLFTIDQIADWEWLDDNVHGILQRNARYPVYEGSIARYCDLMCRLPGGIGRLTGVTAPASA